jgi:hypothetical protein
MSEGVENQIIQITNSHLTAPVDAAYGTGFGGELINDSVRPR